MARRSFVDSQIAVPSSLQARTWLHSNTATATYVARIGEVGDWTAYEGMADWQWEKVAESGHKLSEKKAQKIFPVCAHLTYKPNLKLISLPKRRASVRAAISSFEEALLKAGFEEIEDLKLQRIRAAFLLTEALETAQKIDGSSVKTLSQNTTLLINQLEELMLVLMPQGEEKAPANKLTEEAP